MTESSATLVGESPRRGVPAPQADGIAKLAKRGRRLDTARHGTAGVAGLGKARHGMGTGAFGPPFVVR